MTLFTGCPNCNKAINADLTHKDVVCGPDETKLAAIVICPSCRTNIEISISTRSTGEAACPTLPTTR